MNGELQTDEKISPPKKALLKMETDPEGISLALGKRVQRALNDTACDGEFSSAYDQSHIQDDDDMMAPFAGENISMLGSGGAMDQKPFRNVIKRYWTEDEVIYYLLIRFCGLGHQAQDASGLIRGKQNHNSHISRRKSCRSRNSCSN